MKGRKYLLTLAAMVTAASLFAVSAGANAILNWYFWTDGNGNVNAVNGPGGQYSVNWSGNGLFIAGKGWLQGSPDRIIHYTANDFQTDGNAFLMVYGWTRNPLVEYRVVDNWGNWRPVTADYRGSVYSDGAWYDLYHAWRYNAPSPDGTQTFRQYWSVRQTKRPIGSRSAVTLEAHVKAWDNAGMSPGSRWAHQILAVEGGSGTGQASITVW
ncbi:MAG: 1,4-beta-xylanase [Thermobacillus sp.]|uniref:glycoside hydrolase family 11 protein n=1 Tax=Thermobacillus sp. TaxID=2108467 RepID=UPI000E3A6C2B|nr:glycoside hydrolase family 11 protein [Thermobacillus sp.]REK56561.1 MAG: 1,4-beta-xylanase [Thermobacillus sp.]